MTTRRRLLHLEQRNNSKVKRSSPLAPTVRQLRHAMNLSRSGDLPVPRHLLQRREKIKCRR